MRFRSTWLYR